MERYAGIDVSLESADLCVVDAAGQVVLSVSLDAQAASIARRGRVGHSGSQVAMRVNQLTRVPMQSTFRKRLPKSGTH